MQIGLQLAETNYRLFQLTLRMRKVIRPLPSKLCKCSWCKRTLTTSAKGEQTNKKNLADSASQRKVWPCLRNAVVRGVCPEILRRDRKGRQVWIHVIRVSTRYKTNWADSNTAGQKTLTNKDRMSGLVKHRDHHPSLVHCKWTI